MKIIRDLSDYNLASPTVLTLGTFDGIHLGHSELLHQLVTYAQQHNLPSVVLSFWPHPRMVLQPEYKSLRLLNTIDEKIEILSNYNINYLVFIPFDKDFSQINYLDFIRNILISTFNVQHLIIGYDHHFGRNREGNYDSLLECAPIFNYSISQVGPFSKDFVDISSTKIRNALKLGEVELANSYLGYKYFLTGTVIQGKQLGRELGFPTANLDIESYKLIPADGLYIVEMLVEGKWEKGLASIGTNPTFGESKLSVEVYLFEFKKQIYNQKVQLQFWKFIRKQLTFVDVNELITQMKIDESVGRDFFLI
ncbi:MAG: bifunctional riboflavin kinase/FAD synthetase [Bacteroidota bacterium]|nr:bifunctional riboflavin kinase/FAD synthetase [Bacteroidota bacterium]